MEENFKIKFNIVLIDMLNFIKNKKKKIRAKKYRDENKEKILLNNRKYRQENRIALNIKAQEWRKNNKVRFNKNNNNWYHKNKEKASENLQKYLKKRYGKNVKEEYEIILNEKNNEITELKRTLALLTEPVKVTFD